MTPAAKQRRTSFTNEDGNVVEKYDLVADETKPPPIPNRVSSRNELPVRKSMTDGPGMSGEGQGRKSVRKSVNVQVGDEHRSGYARQTL